MFKNIEALTLISSEACNLNCSYCNIAKEVDPKKHAIIAQEVKNALKSGKYLQNILDFIEEYDIDKTKITKFDLWGQEPTLTMNEIAEAFPSFYKEFPNIKYCFFSTNSVAFYDRIINYIKKVDETVTKPTVFTIQFSFDGTDITEKSRGIDPNIILNNIEKLFKELNKINLKNVTVDCHFHNVITVELIKKLLKDNKEFFNYFEDLDNIINRYLNIIENPKVELLPYFSPGLINPHNASKEDGKALADFYKKCLYYQPKPTDVWESLVYMFENPLHMIKDCHDLRQNTVEGAIEKSAYYELIDEEIEGSFISHLSHALSCGWGEGNLSIRYDGTLMHCHNVLFGMTQEELEYKNKESLRHRIQSQLLKHNYYPNLKDEKAFDNFNLFYERAWLNHNSNFLYSFDKIINYMLLLSECNQISSYYKTDIDKLLRHAFILTSVLPCWDNNLMETGSGYGRTAGHVRFYCNGFIEYIDELWKEQGV